MDVGRIEVHRRWGMDEDVASVVRGFDHVWTAVCDKRLPEGTVLVEGSYGYIAGRDIYLLRAEGFWRILLRAYTGVWHIFELRLDGTNILNWLPQVRDYVLGVAYRTHLRSVDAMYRGMVQDILVSDRTAVVTAGSSLEECIGGYIGMLTLQNACGVYSTGRVSVSYSYPEVGAYMDYIFRLFYRGGYDSTVSGSWSEEDYMMIDFLHWLYVSVREATEGSIGDQYLIDRVRGGLVGGMAWNNSFVGDHIDLSI